MVENHTESYNCDIMKHHYIIIKKSLSCKQSIRTNIKTIIILLMFFFKQTYFNKSMNLHVFILVFFIPRGLKGLCMLESPVSWLYVGWVKMTNGLFTNNVTSFFEPTTSTFHNM